MFNVLKMKKEIAIVVKIIAFLLNLTLINFIAFTYYR